MTDSLSLAYGWNEMGYENGTAVDIDVVVINTHATPSALGFGKNSDNKFTVREIQALGDKEVGMLILYGCNAGHTDKWTENVAAEFCRKVNGAPTLANDGTVFCRVLATPYTYESRNDKPFQKLAGNSNRDNNGWIIYQAINNKNEVSGSIGKDLSITQMLKELTPRVEAYGFLQMIMEVVDRMVNVCSNSSIYSE